MGTFVAPDVLVLAGGGILGEAWMNGVLAGLEESTGVDFRRTEAFVGTSAGSIVGSRLAAGRSPRRPSEPPAEDLGERAGAADDPGAGIVRGVVRGAARWGWAATAPLAPVAVALAAPGGALARAALLSRAPSTGRALTDLHHTVERSGVRFDGRLRVCCVDRRSGRRVVFGAPGAPHASVADAVAASCAIPWVFAPVRINGREYVDGGVWSVTNLDAAPARRDTEVLCLDPTAALRERFGPVRSFWRAVVAVETQILRGRGARVRHLGPDAGSARAMGTDVMDSGPAARVLAAGFRQGLALGR